MGKSPNEWLGDAEKNWALSISLYNSAEINKICYPVINWLLMKAAQGEKKLNSYKVLIV